jgi:alginate O-acetyltransferase complex protein AlgJ
MEREVAPGEEESRAELESTEISRATARRLVWTFCLILAAVPLIETASALAGRRPPPWLAFFAPLPTAARELWAGRPDGAGRALADLVDPGRLHAGEAALERGSPLRAAVQPRLQERLSARLGSGNHQVVLGRDGRLFHAPGIAYLTGRGILDPDHLHVRAREARDRRLEADPHPDPRPAILRFHDDLRRRGIRLVLLPVPDKAMDLGVGPAPNNPDYARFIQEMRDAGIAVLDLAAEPGAVESDRFLRQDTHWTPRFVEHVAAGVAAELRASGLVPPMAGQRRFLLETATVSSTGDLVALLALRAEQRIFPPETVEVHRVVDPRGEPPRRDPSAPVLLLGDSFTNVYSDARLSWGTGAGLAEHLARSLGRAVDVIAQDGSGASGTRRELARNPGRLEGKTVVVWEFAVRELAVGDWRPIALPRPPASATPAVAPAPSPSRPEGAFRLTGRVAAVSKVPAPYSAPYGDCLAAIKIEVERVDPGHAHEPVAVVVFEAMRDNVWLPPARFVPGQRLALEVIAFRDADVQIRTIQRVDDFDDDEHARYFALTWSEWR